MTEHRLFPAGTTPECATPAWYAGRESAPHLDQPMHQGRLHLSAQHVRGAVAAYGARSVVDLGCGDGGLLSILDAGVSAWGYDLQPSNVVVARAGTDVRFGDVLAEGIEWADLAVATEMLEHLVDPHGLLREIRRHASVVVASSPWTETAESHYAHHLFAWDLAGYEALLSGTGWRVVRHDTVDMFQVITGVRR